MSNPASDPDQPDDPLIVGRARRVPRGYDNVDQSTLTRRLSPSLRLSLRRLVL
jgi:hypothetical protein